RSSIPRRTHRVAVMKAKGFVQRVRREPRSAQRRVTSPDAEFLTAKLESRLRPDPSHPAFFWSSLRFLKSSVQTPLLDRFGDMGGLDFFGAGEIGDGAADFEDPAVGAGAQAQFVDRGFEQSLGIVIHGTIALDISGAHLGVGMDVSFLKTLELDVTSLIDTLANHLRGFPSIATGEILIAYRRHFDLNIDSVEERAGDARAIALDLQRRADAFFLRVGKKAAGARVHGCDEHNGCGIVDRAQDARDGDVAVFQRLAHYFEHVAPELRQFVEEEDTVVGKRDFAGLRDGSAADETGIGNRVMRRAERTGRNDR